MGRMSLSLLNRYEVLSQSDHCFYCDAPGTLRDDFTPPVAYLDKFMGTPSRAKVCKTCWNKIYFVNVVKHGHPWVTSTGHMSVQDKRKFLVGETLIDANKIVRLSNGMLAHIDTMFPEEGGVLFRGRPLLTTEFEELQSAFAAKLQNVREDLIQRTILYAVAAGGLKMERLETYYEMVDI